MFYTGFDAFFSILFPQVLHGLSTGLPRMYTMQAQQLLLKKKTEEVSQTLEHLML